MVTIIAVDPSVLPKAGAERLVCVRIARTPALDCELQSGESAHLDTVGLVNEDQVLDRRYWRQLLIPKNQWISQETTYYGRGGVACDFIFPVCKTIVSSLPILS